MINIGDYIRVDLSDNLYEVLNIVIKDDVLRVGSLKDCLSYYTVMKDNEEAFYLKHFIDKLNEDLIRDKKLNKLGI